MSANVSAAKKQFVSFDIRYLITKKPEDPSRVVLRKKALETFTPSPVLKVHHCRNTKIINPQFFAVASPLHLNDMVQKFIKYAGHSNNYSNIYLYTN